jgi:hypothetical protein
MGAAADPSQQPCQLDNGDEKQQVEALMREIKSGVVDDDDPDAARRAKQRGMQQAAAAKRQVVTVKSTMLSVSYALPEASQGAYAPLGHNKVIVGQNDACQRD